MIFLWVGPSVDGRDRWGIGWGGVNRLCWSMPKLISFGKHFSTIKV